MRLRLRSCVHKIIAPIAILAVGIGALPTAGDAPALAAPTYRITDLGLLPHLAEDVSMGINASGQVSLWDSVGPVSVRASFWTGAQRQAVAVPAQYPNSVARAVNDAGQVAGWAGASANPVDSLAATHGIVADSGKTRVLDTLGGRDSRAYGLNNRGQVVGVADLSGGRRHAFLDDGKTMTDLGTLPGGDFSQAYAVNDAGRVAGVSVNARSERRAVLWRDGKATDLGTLPGGHVSAAVALNNRDQAAGFSACKDGYHAFLWTDGRMQDLGTLGSDPSAASGLNDLGDVVGSSNVSGIKRHAFLWHGGRMADLNALVPVGVGWELTQADAINDHGQIVCTGRRGRGPLHALLLTPVPVHP